MAETAEDKKKAEDERVAKWAFELFKDQIPDNEPLEDVATMTLEQYAHAAFDVAKMFEGVRKAIQESKTI
jgi:hypothetical protein